MDKLFVAWVRGFVCVLTLACLSACGGGGSDDSSSTADTPAAPPVAGNPTPDPVDPTPADPTPNPAQPANVSPHIAGTPGTEVIFGQAYSFTPNATDADGDSLTFSIASKPGWASFNNATGRLSGTPAAGDVGSHEEIAISVSDGESTVALAQFAINVVQQSNGNVTLAWQAPTENTDGSPLVNLNGYKIHYGTESGNYTTTIAVNNAGLTRYVIENLAAGPYFFAITAVTSTGVESDLSGEASKTI